MSEVSEQCTAPDPLELFPVSTNNAALFNFLCMAWSQNEELKSSIGSTHLYLGGGFTEETKSKLVSNGNVNDVAELQSTQHKADTRVILHSATAF